MKKFPSHPITDHSLHVTNLRFKFLQGAIFILRKGIGVDGWSRKCQKKSKNATLNFLDFFFLFFLFFFQTAVDRVKMIFQTPNKGLICFKHYKFLIFDEKQLPQKFCYTYLQISLVPCS